MYFPVRVAPGVRLPALRLRWCLPIPARPPSSGIKAPTPATLACRSPAGDSKVTGLRSAGRGGTWPARRRSRPRRSTRPSPGADARASAASRFITPSNVGASGARVGGWQGLAVAPGACSTRSTANG
jgi:hypothetical protein